MKCAYCHNIIITDLQAQTLVELPEGDVPVHAVHCKEAIQKAIKKGETMNILKRLSAAIVLLGLLAFSVFAEEIREEKEWVWGCQIRGRTLDGNCVVRRFTKVGDADNDVDTDEEQVLGFEPGNVPIARDGQPIFSRLRSALFMKPGEVRLVSASKCSCSK